jgi:hypothetical protein
MYLAGVSVRHVEEALWGTRVLSSTFQNSADCGYVARGQQAKPTVALEHQSRALAKLHQLLFDIPRDTAVEIEAFTAPTGLELYRSPWQGPVGRCR